MTQAYIKCALELPANEGRESMMQELALDLKYTLAEKLDTFTAKAKDLMLDFDYYNIYYDF